MGCCFSEVVVVVYMLYYTHTMTKVCPFDILDNTIVPENNTCVYMKSVNIDRKDKLY